MDVLSKVISMILVAILIFLLPLQYLFGHQLHLFDDYIENEVINLVDDIRDKSYLDVEMYETFLKKVSITGTSFDIEIEHAVPKTGSDIISSENIPGVIVASSDLHSLPSLRKVDDYENTGSGETYSLATHTHTSDCYAGHRHDASCVPVGAPTQVYANYYWSSSYVNTYPYTQIDNHRFTVYCGQDNKQLAEITIGLSWGGYNAYITLQTTYASYDSSGNVVTKNYYRGIDYPFGAYATTRTQLVILKENLENYIRSQPIKANYSNQINTQNFTWTYGGFPAITAYDNFAGPTMITLPYIGCPYHGLYGQNYSCGQVQDENAICNQVVASITATNPTQSVDKGGSIITSATATYLDGHTGIVNCTSNYNPNQVGIQNVTLTYSGLVGNAKTYGTRISTLNVTVKETNIPASLMVTASAYSVYNGVEPSYTVVLTYSNGTTKTLSSGYTRTGWSTGYGIKTVTFSYSENGRTVQKSVVITVKANILRITVDPAIQTIERYKEASYSVRAYYEDGTSQNVFGFTTVGFNKYIIGTQNVTIQYSENAYTRSCYATVIVTPMKRICPDCGNEYFIDANDFDQGCPVCKNTVSSIQVSPGYFTVTRGEPLGIVVTATYKDGHTEEVTGWTSNYDPYKVGSQLVMVTYNGLYAYVSVTVVQEKVCSICGTTYALDEDGTDSGCPICKKYLMLISATPENQVVEQGEEITLTVTAIYRDGHTETVNEWSSSYDKDIVGEQNVTVYYNYKTCSIRVNVVSEEEVQCPICKTYYNYRDYPWGCPLCAGTIIRIEATLLSGGTRTTYGKPLELAVVLIYRDNHREMTYEGYQDNFNPYVMGEQDVTVSYTDKFNNNISCLLTVDVVDKLTETICENGHVYYAEDGACPYCAAINGNGVSLYSSCNFTDEILNELYDDQIYYLSKGDYISIKVTLRTEGSIYSMGLFRKNEGTTPITYGGEIA